MPQFNHLDSLSTALLGFKKIVSALTTIKTKPLIFCEDPTRHALAMEKTLLCPSHITFLNNSGVNIGTQDAEFLRRFSRHISGPLDSHFDSLPGQVGYL